MPHTRPHLVTLTPDGYPFIDGIIRAAAADPTRGLGYPRCDDLGELLAELDLYHISARDAIWLIEAGHRRVGFTGLLVDEDGFTAVIGPMLDTEFTTALVAQAVLREVELLARGRVPHLSNVVCLANEVLVEAQTAAGWRPHGEAIEMVYALGATKGERPTSRSLPGPCSPMVNQVAEVLRAGFGWTDAPGRVDELIQEGYRILYQGTEDEMAGCAVWMPVPDTTFARLESVAVVESARGRGVATQLIRDVQHAAQAVGASSLYLSVDADNIAAQSLYQKAGFMETVRSVEFVKSLRTG